MASDEAPDETKRTRLDRVSNFIKSINVLAASAIALMVIVVQFKEQAKTLWCQFANCEPAGAAGAEIEKRPKPDAQPKITATLADPPAVPVPVGPPTATAPKREPSAAPIRKFSERYSGFCSGPVMFVKRADGPWKINTFKETISLVDSRVKLFFASAAPMNGLDIRLVSKDNIDISKVERSPKIIGNMSTWNFKTPDQLWLYDCQRENRPPVFGYEVDIELPVSLTQGSYEVWWTATGKGSWSGSSASQLQIYRN